MNFVRIIILSRFANLCLLIPMSVDFPPSYPVNTTPVSKPVDVQTLQETFAVLLRSYGIDKGGLQTNTLLEILRPAQPDNTESEDRNQPYRDRQSPVERNDLTQIDRKLQEKSEVRNSDMNDDYRNRLDRQSTLQHDYHAKIEHRELPASTIPTNTAAPVISATPPPDVMKPNELSSGGNSAPPQQKEGTKPVGTNNPINLTETLVPKSAVINTAGLVTPMSMNAPVSMPASAVQQVTPPQTFTVFTPLGRFGHSQEKADDKENENEDEEPVEENFSNTTKKKQPFAAFEAIRTETTRPLHRNHSPQPKREAELRQTTAQPHEKPKETEPEQSHSIKTPSVQTMEELMNIPVQDIAVPKKGESNQPNQIQYIHRIAAACEAAAHYAPIRMKINLDHLGTLTLRFSYKADKLALRFETPSKESAHFLRNHLDGLKAILSKRNVKIVDIAIE